MDEHRHHLGRVGEEAAIHYLQGQGYRILKHNFRCRFGEIDLIARDGDVLVFIEVKTRRSHAFGPPAAAVTLRKQHHIVKVAQWYLAHMGGGQETCRFDVVTIEMNALQLHIEIIKNAFQPTASPG
jgi:putative endonuclease